MKKDSKQPERKGGSRHEIPAESTPISGYERSKAAMSAMLRAIVWFFIFPGEWASDQLGVSQSDNRDLVRMLVNSLFWVLVAVVGLAIWTSTLPIYN